MKRFLWTLPLLAAVLFTLGCVPSPAEEVTAYELWLGETQVTSANRDDILGDGGRAKFDPDTGTLTLDRPTITGHHDYAVIDSYIDLTVKGSCSVESDAFYFIRTARVTMEGDFRYLSLQPSGPISEGIYAPVDFTFVSGTLVLDCGRETLTSSNATVKEGVTKIDLTSRFSSAYNPSRTHFQMEGSMGFSTDEVADHVVIEPGYKVKDTWLGNKKVTYENCLDIFGDGKASLDPETYVLTLNEPAITGSHTDENGISAVIRSGRDITIRGSFHQGSAGSKYGVYTGGRLTLGGDFAFEGTEAGIAARSLAVEENTTLVEMRGGFTGLSLTDGECRLDGTLGFSEPLHGEPGTAGGRPALLKQDGTAAARVVIRPYYGKLPVWLGTRQVYWDSCGDILGDGKAAYDAETHTLTLNSPIIPGIHTDSASNTAKICSDGLPLTVKGRYHMSEAEAQYGVLVKGAGLTLDGDLTFRGSKDGAFTGYDPSLNENATDMDSLQEAIDIYYRHKCGSAVLGGNVTLSGDGEALRVQGPATLRGNAVLTGGQYGLLTMGKITLAGGSISIRGGKIGAYNCLCDTGDTFEMRSGTVTVTGEHSNGLFMNTGPLEFNGGSFTATAADGGYGVLITSGDIHINGGTVTCVSVDNAYRTSIGMEATRGTVYVNGSAERVTLDGGDAALSAVGLVISNEDGQKMRIVEPEEASFSEDNKAVYKWNGSVGTVAEHVVFSHDIALFLGGTAVTAANRSDIFGDGKASYDPDTGVLTLHDPVITGDKKRSTGGSSVKIYTNSDRLTIRGSYHMTEKEGAYGVAAVDGAVTLDGSFTFLGNEVGVLATKGIRVSGHVTASGGTTAGAASLNGDIDIAGGVFYAESGRWGVNASGGRLIIRPQVETATIVGTGSAAIVAWEGISFPTGTESQIRIVSPARPMLGSRTIYDPDYVPDDAGQVYTEVSSEGYHPARYVQFDSDRLYGLSLGNTPVSAFNAGDILGDGTASYDPVTHTLTLNEPDITGCAVSTAAGVGSSFTILATGIDRLTLKGKWHMASQKDDYGILVSNGSLVLDGSFTIMGKIGAVAALDDIVSRSGRLYAYGGEIGAIAKRLVVQNGSGGVELKSDSKEVAMLGEGCEMADGYRIKGSILINFRDGQTVHTASYHKENMTAVRRRIFPPPLYGDKYEGVDYIQIADITGFEGSGSAEDPYLIGNAEDWAALAECVEAGYDLSAKHFGLKNDVTVSAMIGTSEKPFSGTFDGLGHRLTFNYTATEETCAPFRYVDTAVFKNLRVGGTVSTGKKFAAGLAGQVSGSCRIVNCESVVNIVSSVSGDGTHGGFVAAGANVTFAGCVFSGSITGAETTLCAGFQGWDRGGSSVVYCVYNGTVGTKSDTATFIRNKETAENCYYSEVIGQGRDYGKALRPVVAVAPVMLDFGSGMTYGVSGITAYPVGIGWGGGFCAGEGDKVTVRISYASVANGRAIDAYVNAGELTAAEDGEYELTMPDETVGVSAVIVPNEGSGTEEDPWLLTGRFFYADLYSGWYKTAESMTARQRLVVNGETRLVLKAGTTLTAEHGVNVKAGNTLVISGGGTLNAYAETGNAGIGGDVGQDCGTVVVTGGTVNARGSVFGAGIGGGQRGAGGVVTISGGAVNAQCYDENDANVGLAAGIGGGDLGNGGTLTITGGTVYARGSRGSAGIGGGGYANGGTVTISGGHVTAIGSVYPKGRGGAGIGAGRSRNSATAGDSGTVTITGGTVIAVGGGSGQAIGVSAEVAGNDSGTLNVGEGLMVRSGADEASAVLRTGADCVPACRAGYAKIEPVPAFGEAELRLPGFLKKIEREAFWGIGARSVEIPAGCRSIAARAFQDCPDLWQVRIPESCSSISDNAFLNCKEVLIYGKTGSAAEEYCRTHDNCVFIAE